MSGKTLTTLRLLPLQVNQGHLRHSNIIIDHEEQYRYDGEYAFEVCIICREHVMSPIVMGHHVVK